jgi:site-specific DNA recombinase
MDRPALKRLMADIEAGRVDCVVVYKVDRLSRSLLDFARMMEVFERHNVSFVSVTQQFNTASSMGRLILNVLLSFAQFEREMISERTRDKIAATRRKGKWAGGMPVLGYDLVDSKLLVNEIEADRVRQIFDLYLESQSLLTVVKELDARGWHTKNWTTRKEKQRGDRPFTKNSLHRLLTNVTYLGQIRYKDEVHSGEHAAIVDAPRFSQVQELLQSNGRSGGRAVRNKHGALLKGLLRCATCNSAMAHSFTTKAVQGAGNQAKGSTASTKRRYRYYVCTQAQQRGWNACPAPSLPAEQIEQFVIEQIKRIGRDPALVAATLAETRRQSQESTQGLRREKDALVRQRRADEAELASLAVGPMDDQLPRLAQVQEQISRAARRLAELEDDLACQTDREIDHAEVTAALAEFDGMWDALMPREQTRILELLIERVDHDGQQGSVAITFHPSGIQALAADLTQQEEDAA